MWLTLVGVVILGAMITVKGDAEVMSHVTAHFGKSLEECREESGLSMEDMEQFHHFWSDDFAVVKRELGCAIICMANKFSLMNDDTKVHHINMEEYIKSFPNGEALSNKMVDMIHECEKKFHDDSDECLSVVKSAECFKEQAKLEGIAPELAMIEAVLEQY